MICPGKGFIRKKNKFRVYVHFPLPLGPDTIIGNGCFRSLSQTKSLHRLFQDHGVYFSLQVSTSAEFQFDNATKWHFGNLL